VKHHDRLEDLAARVGQPLGTSDWMRVDQSTIDAFASVTRDPQWIHIDPVRAAQGPFGATIAHGFLTLSLHSALVVSAFRIGDVRMGVNAGFDRVRFTAPVRAGERVRATFVLATFEPQDDGAKLALDTTVEIEGRDKPACVSRWIVRQYT
jgi:acyl dehydratase